MRVRRACAWLGRKKQLENMQGSPKGCSYNAMPTKSLNRNLIPENIFQSTAYQGIALYLTLHSFPLFFSVWVDSFAHTRFLQAFHHGKAKDCFQSRPANFYYQ